MLTEIINFIKKSNNPIEIYSDKCLTVTEYIKKYSKTKYKPLCKAPSDAVKLVMSGIILGDIFESLYEGFGITEYDDPDYIMPFTDIHSRFTDDTIMSFAIYEGTKEALKYPKVKNDCIIDIYAKNIKKWAKKYPTAGYGSHFYDWAVLNIENQYASFGDGAAMRSGIIGAMCENYQDVIKYAVCSAIPSHAHPEGVKGAVLTAASVWLALHGYTKEDILKLALKYYPDGFKTKETYTENHWLAPDLAIDDLIVMQPCTLSVTTQIAMPESIINICHSNTFEDVLRNSVRYLCDSDTVGAISGGIAAALYRDISFVGIDTEKVLNNKLTENNLYKLLCTYK